MRILSIRSFLFVIAVLLLSATTSSCSREDDPEEQKEEQEDKKVEDWENEDINGDATMESGPMRFFIGSVDGMTRSSTTYAGVCNLSEDDLVAVGITRSGESEDVKLYKVLSTGYLEYAGSGEPFLWKSRNEQVSIRAWSYGRSSATTANGFNLTTKPEDADYSLEPDQDSNGYNELLYCKSMSKKCSDGTITFTFYHQLARVVFNVTHERAGTLSVTSTSIGNTSSFPTKARFSVPSGSSNYGTWTTKNTYNTISPKTETTQSGYQKTYSAVVFPGTAYAKNTYFFTITNSDGNYVYSIPGASDVTLTAGSQYFYTITVKDRLKLPIEYVAEHNMQTATTMATNNYPSNSAYFYWGSDGSSTSYLTTQMKNFMNGITISGTKYHLPSVKEVMSVIAPIYATSGYVEGIEGESGKRITYGNTVFTQTGLGEPLEWGRKSDGTYLVSGKFYNEYATNPSYTSTEGGITYKYGYGIRLKDKDIAGPSGYGKYTCAYRYTYATQDATCNNAPSTRVRVKYLGTSSTVTLSDIVGNSNASFWESDYYEVIFPHCGNFTDAANHNAGTNSSARESSEGFYWSATPLNTANAHYFRLLPAEIRGDNWRNVYYSFNVRLFKDE